MDLKPLRNVKNLVIHQLKEELSYLFFFRITLKYPGTKELVISFMCLFPFTICM